MRARLEHSLDSGFVVREEDLRRLNEDISNRFDAIEVQGLHERRVGLEAVLSDGGVVEGDSVDDILALENGGQHTILSLKYIQLLAPADRASENLAELARDSDVAKVVVTFKTWSESPRTHSISYVVHGPDRDWVVLTMASVKDRISRTTRVGLPRLETMAFLTGLIGVVALGLVVSVQSRSSFILDEQQLSLMRSRIAGGEIGDALDAVLFVEESRAELVDPWSSLLVPSGVVVGLLALAAGVYIAWTNFFPDRVFAWGDQLARYERLQTLKSRFLWAVPIGLAVAVSSALLVSRIS